MAIDVIPKSIQRFWDEWNLRVSVLASLGLQILLIFLAPHRKRSRGYALVFTLWSAYLLADWVAAFAVGLISNNQGKSCDKLSVDDALSSFWAPFLLLHLGGPDTITAFALEDNELWIRHLLGLIVQLVLVAYVFTQAIPSPYWLPTVLTFIAGAVKYGERTHALYMACLDNFKESLQRNPEAGPNYAQLMEEFSSMQLADLPVEIKVAREPEKTAQDGQQSNRRSNEDSFAKFPDEKENDIIHRAYELYNTFRGLIVDHMFGFLQRNQSREIFLSLDAGHAFRLLEVELNFMYDTLFTKMCMAHKDFLGYVFRFTCTGLIVATFVLFQIHPKPGVHHFDVAITYSLLVGAIVLDFVALVKLIFCDWTVARMEHKKFSLFLYKVHKWLSSSRWSNSMSQFDWISYSTRSWWRKRLASACGQFASVLEEKVEEFQCARDMAVKNSLKLFIFNEIKEKAEDAAQVRDAKEIYSSRGERALLYYTCRASLVSSVNEEVDYDESVLIWHVATDMLYHIEKDRGTETHTKETKRGLRKTLHNILSRYMPRHTVKPAARERDEAKLAASERDEPKVAANERDEAKPAVGKTDEAKAAASEGDEPKAAASEGDEAKPAVGKTDEAKAAASEADEPKAAASEGDEAKPAVGKTDEANKAAASERDEATDYREICKTLSDYMLYLLIMKQTMMSNVAGIAEIRFQDTCCEAEKFMERGGIPLSAQDAKIRFYKKLETVNPVVKPIAVKGDTSKSVLFDACVLAKELRNSFDDKTKIWEMMSKVWLELLCYGASHCRGNSHAQQLSKGGELITFVWLLMTHFGLSEQFRIQAGQARAKLLMDRFKCDL